MATLAPAGGFNMSVFGSPVLAGALAMLFAEAFFAVAVFDIVPCPQAAVAANMMSADVNRVSRMNPLVRGLAIDALPQPTKMLAKKQVFRKLDAGRPGVLFRKFQGIQAGVSRCD